MKSELGLCPLPQHLGGCGNKANEKQTRDLQGGGGGKGGGGGGAGIAGAHSCFQTEDRGSGEAASLQPQRLCSRTPLTAPVKFRLQEISPAICSLSKIKNSGSGLQVEQIS